MQMNYYPKILPFYMTYPMPLIWEEEDTVMRDLEYLQELYPSQAKKYRKRIEELLERFDSEGSVLYDEYPDKYMIYHLGCKIRESMELEISTQAIREDFLDELIQVMLCQEISRRRCRRYRCRRYF